MLKWSLGLSREVVSGSTFGPVEKGDLGDLSPSFGLWLGIVVISP